MTYLIPVGTPVTVSANNDHYLKMYGMIPEDLVVLAHSGGGIGYGLGPAKNDPKKAHSRHGWIYFSRDEVTPKKESNTVSKFKEGDKVEVFDNGCTSKPWVGVQGIVKDVLSLGGYHVELTETAQTGEKVGYVAFLIGSNLKLVEEAKRELKVGDKVLVDADKPEATWHNTEGVITKLRYANTHCVKVTKAGPHNADFVGLGKEYILSNLTLLPEFTFKDIQVGDTVRRTRKYKDGSTEVYEGVITRKSTYYAENDNLTVAYNSDSEDGGVTLELVNRPEPVKETWETAKAGDRLVVKGEGGTRILTKQEDGYWETLIVKSDGRSHFGFQRSDRELKNALGRKDFNADGNHKFYPAS